jgi:hypothetical protein
MFRKTNDAGRRRVHSRRADRRPEKKRKRREVKLLGGLAAGVIGDIVATWALDRYQEGSTPIVSRRPEDQLQEQERAHAEVAERITKAPFGKRLSRTQRRNAAPIVHYAVGALTGGIYGLTAEVLPIIRRGYGTGYSNLLFLGGSEALLPWFNVGRRKVQSSGGLTAPLVYGAVLETTRRVLRWLL